MSVVWLQDFVVTAVFTFFWLVSSCAWAKGLSDVKTATDPDRVITFITACDEQENRCKEVHDAKVSGLNTSVVRTRASSLRIRETWGTDQLYGVSLIPDEPWEQTVLDLLKQL